MINSKEKEFAVSLLSSLCNTYTPSGHEFDGVLALDEHIIEIDKNNQLEKITDRMYNSVYKFGHGDKKILLTGHIDEVHCRVTKVFDNGILAVKSTGGLDKKAIIGGEVRVIDGNGDIHFGACVKKPMHLENDDEYNKVGEWKEFRVDVGAESADEVKQMNIYPGCYVTYPRTAVMNFGNNRMCACGLDDKIGVLISILILKRLLESPIRENIEDAYTIYAGCTTQEETGCRGAQVLAKRINPDVSIDFDVNFATDDESGSDANDVGTNELGKGGIIAFGCDKTERITSLLKQYCDRHDIPYQTIATRAGGTNTSSIQLASDDCETALISIPNRSMHTQVEVCDWRDVFAITDLVEGVISNFDL